jgi:hypothetical protein
LKARYRAEAELRLMKPRCTAEANRAGVLC